MYRNHIYKCPKYPERINSILKLSFKNRALNKHFKLSHDVFD